MDTFHYLDFIVTFSIFWVLPAHIHDEYQDASYLNVLKKYSAYEEAEVACGCFSWSFIIAENSCPRTLQRCPHKVCSARPGPLWSSAEVPQIVLNSKKWCFFLCGRSVLCAGIIMTVKIAYWLSVFLETKPIPWHNFWWDVFVFCFFFFSFLW